MAGIGFELKKLFVGRGAIRKVRAYAYASIVCSGTMLLAVVLLLGIQRLAKLYGATDSDSETLIAMMVYALIGSLMLSSVYRCFCPGSLPTSFLWKRLSAFCRRCLAAP